MDGLVGDVEGTKIIKGHVEGQEKDHKKLGTSLAEDLLSRGAKEILDEVYGQGSSSVNGEVSS
jgi:hydroxymethylbilane synthase